MAASTVPKVRRDGTLQLIDGTGTPNTFTVSYEQGDVSFDGGAKADRIVIKDRGVIVGLRQGDDPVPSLSWSVYARSFTDGTSNTLIDIINKTGSAASWISTGGTGYEQYLLDIKLTVEGTDLGDSADHSATALKCLVTWSFAEGDPDMINCTAEVYGGFTYSGQS
jgi:hypothetical protein|tara:strand:+ start:2229 stop:2726 length:498 start_codon:yes stop_codon:yes gene_type:complete